MEVVSFASQDVVESPAERWSCQQGEMRKRFELVSAGRWQELLADSVRLADEASNALHRRRRRRNADDSDRRAAGAHALVQFGELSAGRVA